MAIFFFFISKSTSQTNKNDKLRLVFSPENHLLEKLLKQASMAIGMKDPIGVSNSSAIELEVVKGHCIAGVQFKHSAVRLVF